MSLERAASMPLAGPLAALLLPDARQTLLLQAALEPPDAAAAALATWLAGARAATEDLAAGPGGGRLLAPLIAHNLAGMGDQGAPRLWTYLRTALVREQLRARAARAIYAEALNALGRAGVAPVVLRGVAASETVYPDPGLRHCHDLDLLVPGDRRAEAGQALTAAGFRATPDLATAGTRRFAHGSGMPVTVHTELFAAPRYRREPEPLLGHLRSATCAGAPAQALDPAGQVLHLLIHAAEAYSRATLLWACDVWLTIRAHPDLDWARVAGEAARRGAALPVTLLLGYLAKALRAPVPEPTLAGLADAATQATSLDVEVALWGAWAVPDARLDRALGSAAGPGERATLLRWRLAPRPAALVLAGRTAPGRGWLGFYLGRPWRLLARGLGRGASTAPVRVPGA